MQVHKMLCYGGGLATKLCKRCLEVMDIESESG